MVIVVGFAAASGRAAPGTSDKKERIRWGRRRGEGVVGVGPQFDAGVVGVLRLAAAFNEADNGHAHPGYSRVLYGVIGGPFSKTRGSRVAWIKL